MLVQKEPWEVKAAAKRASTYSKISREWLLAESDLDNASKERNLTGTFIEKYLTEGEIEITKAPAPTLVSKIRYGSYKATEVTRAFCKRTAIAQQMNNCLHEIFFEQAFQRAKDLDTYFQEHKTTIGPLHGLPISLKDQFHVHGNDTSMGYVGWLDTYEGKKDHQLVHQMDSQIVSELLSLGAVLYCKTSLPQTLLFGETANNLIGTTLNPLNQKLSCGGSSGGEGALAALGGSPVGVGTDIGGSVRIPAGFCGIFSVKPTTNRFSYRDVANAIPGETTYPSSVGFLSSSLDALHLIMGAVLSTSPWLRDPYTVEIPWRQEIVDATLRRANEEGLRNDMPHLKLGIFWTDGVVTPHPPIQRGLRSVAEDVRGAGHEIIDWKPPTHKSAKKIHVSFLKADGAHDIHRQLNLSGEPLIPPLRRTFELRDPMSLLKYQALTVEGKKYEESYLDYWNSMNKQDGQAIDAVIMPVAPHAAVIPGKYYYTCNNHLPVWNQDGKCSHVPAYTECINLLNYSVVVIPVTKADKSLDKADEKYTPLNEVDAKNWEAYDPDVYDGAPVGLQIVGRKYEEEKVWAIAKIVSSTLKGRER